MYERVLLPTDGSAVAEAAADAAAALADRFGAQLHVIYVHGPGDGGVDEFAEYGERAITAAEERATDAGVDVATAVLEDDQPTHRSILDYADEHGIDCIVMGTHGRTGLDRFVLGSVTELTLRESPVPVMTIHEETVVDPDFGSVLVPTDGSESAAAAADVAIELVRSTGGTLDVVYVVDPTVVAASTDVGVVIDALEDTGERAVEAIAERAEERSVSAVETATLTGTPSRSIVDYADEHGIDCIVMGTRGHTGLERQLLGSVTERVVRLSTVPVLVAKERESSGGAREDSNGGE